MKPLYIILWVIILFQAYIININTQTIEHQNTRIIRALIDPNYSPKQDRPQPYGIWKWEDPEKD